MEGSDVGMSGTVEIVKKVVIIRKGKRYYYRLAELIIPVQRVNKNHGYWAPFSR